MTRQLKSVVLGATGQDGYYLCGALARLGHEVFGVVREGHSERLINHQNINYDPVQITCAKDLSSYLTKISPDRVYHLAAVHGSRGTQYENLWRTMVDVNVNSLHCVLEYCRNSSLDTEVFYASSARVYGTRFEGVVSVSCTRSSRDLYGLSKNVATDLLLHYSREFGIKAVSIHFFPHESYFRPETFFSKRIINALRSAICDKNYKTVVDDLLFFTDLGDAEEFMNALSSVDIEITGTELVFATGRTWSAIDLVRDLFLAYGLDYNNHVISRNKDSRNMTLFTVDTQPLRTAIGGDIHLNGAHVLIKIANEVIK